MWIITVIERSPKNGAEIMDGIEEMSLGWWRPSRGSVYPPLDELTNEGLLKKRDDEKYELTDKAREELQMPFWMPFRRVQTVEEMLNEISGYVFYFEVEDLKRSDESKIVPHKDKLENIIERLSALISTVKSKDRKLEVEKSYVVYLDYTKRIEEIWELL